MQNDLAVGGGLENRTFALELVAQNVRVNQITVVPNRHLAADAIDHERLRVLDRAGAGGRIAGVADRAAAFESLQFGLTKNLRDKPHVFVNEKRRAGAVAGNNAGAFLAAMLEREKPGIGQDRGVRVSEHAEKPALVLRINVALLGEFGARSRKAFGVVWRDHKK